MKQALAAWQGLVFKIFTLHIFTPFQARKA
jgi:hypothetical protein